MEARVKCHDREYVVRNVPMTVENIKKLYSYMSKFPTIFGRPIRDYEDFLNIFADYSYPHNDIIFRGLFWSIDDFETGVFYLTDMSDYSAEVHFAFFDRRIAWRGPLFQHMLKYAFEYFKFQRLTAVIPKYVKEGVHSFVKAQGFKEEGIKRSCAYYRNHWWDSVYYGILKKEVLKEIETWEPVLEQQPQLQQPPQEMLSSLGSNSN